MVDEKTIKETLTILKVTYPNALKDIDKQTALLMIQVWTNDFKDTPKELFLKAINNIRNKNKFFPSVADIKEEIAKMKVVGIPEAEEEWQEVLKTVSRYGSYRQEEAMQSLKPYTAKIAGYIGYTRICMSTPEEQVWNKKEFISEYDALKDKIVVDLQIGAENIKGSYLLENKEVDIVPRD